MGHSEHWTGLEIDVKNWLMLIEKKMKSGEANQMEGTTKGLDGLGRAEFNGGG